MVGVENSLFLWLVVRKMLSGRLKLVLSSVVMLIMYRFLFVVWMIRLMSLGDIVEMFCGELILRKLS